MKYLFPLLFFLAIAIIAFLCDWMFKHILWRFVSQATAVQIRWTTALMLWAIIGLAAFNGYDNTRFDTQTNEVEIASSRLPKSFDGFRLAQISDMHLASFANERGHAFIDNLVDSLIAMRPDAIVFTGDLVTIESKEAIAFAQQFTRLAASGIPVYSIMGNHDYADYAGAPSLRWRIEDRRRLKAMQEEWGWQMLNNTHISLHRKQDSIQLVGVENVGEPPYTTYGNLQKAMGALSAADTAFTILLSHNPHHWRSEVLPKTRIDLTLSGHTHAMQLSFFGWSPAAWRYKEWGGLYNEGQQYLYVNTGIGTTGPPTRIGVRPEITLITLRSKAS